MSSETAIKVENLSKCYEIYAQPRDRLKQFVVPRLRRLIGVSPTQYFRAFWALRDVSFEVKKGETVGIIGRNGSGKSTLLQMVCGTLNATSGCIQTDGRIAALLELGSGFNIEFTGRENVYMNGAVLGLTKEEVDSRFDDIAAFADIGDFLDQPVKVYSSGMAARLAFSAAIHASPQILVVDEALAVGDFQFQNKCHKKIKSIKENGVSILLVSHDLSAISRFCDWALVLSNGEIKSIGSTAQAINDFKQICFSVSSDQDSGAICGTEDFFRDKKFSDYYKISSLLHKSGSGEVKIVDWCMVMDGQRFPVSVSKFNHDYTIKIFVRCFINNVNPNVGFFFTDVRGNEIAGSAINHESVFLGPLKEGAMVAVQFSFKMILKPGSYFLNLGCSEFVDSKLRSYDRLYSLTEIVVTGKKDLIGNMYISPRIAVSSWD